MLIMGVVMVDKLREEFEQEMRSNGMFDSGSDAMERCVETGGYIDQDTNAMWSGFLIGRKFAAHSEKDAARYRWLRDECKHVDWHTIGASDPSDWDDVVDECSENMQRK